MNVCLSTSGDHCGFRFARQSVHALTQRHLNHLRGVHRHSIRVLRNLLPATESIGDDQRVLRFFAHLRQQHALASFDGDVVVFARFKPERAGHTAAAVFRLVEVDAHVFEHFLLRE